MLECRVRSADGDDQHVQPDGEMRAIAQGGAALDRLAVQQRVVQAARIVQPPLPRVIVTLLVIVVVAEGNLDILLAAAANEIMKPAENK